LRLREATPCSTQRTSTSSGGKFDTLSPELANRARWDDDVVFKGQARGTEDKKPKEFVNDLLRSDFHKRFMVSRVVRDASANGR
jgi:Cwf15/Cwc15 cell cycle control protein